MKKVLLLLVTGMVCAFQSQSQSLNQFCVTDYYTKKAMDADPSIAIERANLERFTQQFEQNAQVRRTTTGGAPLYIIPLVFHILHNYGPENISEAQVRDAVDILNADYRKLNADTTVTIPVFQGIAADAQIEFRLATIDPSGNCTNGIDRIQTLTTYAADDGAKLNPWPNNKYLNIWVANSLVNAGAAAYAYYPGVASNSVDGVMARYNYVGSIEQSNFNNSRTLTHEIGHCLNLAHCWGSTNDPGVSCGDDGVSDTPITKGFTACTLNASICNPPIIENVQNYMDYSYCNTMFTAGQAVRMQAALNSSLSRRNNLWTTANLIATGTDGSAPQLCIPIADFYSVKQTVCTNTAVQFYDQSWRGRASSWSWDFPGGTPSTSTDSSPSVSYAAPGTYSATLTVGNATGTSSVTKTNFVRIGGAPVASIPYTNDFEATTVDFPGTDGYLYNQDNGITWQLINTTSSNGTYSIRINNYTNTDGQIDEWILPSMDFSNVTVPSMTFKLANAQRTSTSSDALKVFGSQNCGENWTQRYSKQASGLATAGIVATSFTPSSASQWRQETVSLNPFALKSNVRLKFQNISNRGNNTYIDEINVTGTLVSIEDAQDVQTGFAVYPNPSNGVSNVSFFLANNNEVTVEIKDITGKLIQTVASEMMTNGMHEFALPQLSAGVYMIDLSIGAKHNIRKLIVQ